MPDECVVVLSTLPADADAAGLASALVEARVAACVNILPPMTSIYRWAAAVEEASEIQLAIKTTRASVPALWDKLRALHPYDVPEFVVLPIVDGSAPYLNWLRDATAAER
jgi:periplasmic divalent cation tolerance protein